MISFDLGWDSLGCVAGEVKDGGKTYPIAIMIAMILITINYAFPGLFILADCFSNWNSYPLLLFILCSRCRDNGAA